MSQKDHGNLGKSQEFSVYQGRHCTNAVNMLAVQEGLHSTHQKSQSLNCKKMKTFGSQFCEIFGHTIFGERNEYYQKSLKEAQDKSDDKKAF